MQNQLAISQNRCHFAVFDDPGRIFPGLFDAPNFFDVVSGIEEISIDVPGPIAESKSKGGKTKGRVSGLGAFISAISNQRN